ncbi:Lipopolysaccharide biosynthesis protein wzxC [Serratia fonticola]|uniref:lipopolysaccharide biosynthesis protein n=1 Tax=Serratia fonticola TaxID=47917 RepID=UPI00218275A8|nr:lipopolysaccharide biosynthesis protein [Serratia fonticola]CAI2136906.1 Lipopolysaccharide biosynthesis protein wzxC [Serratia fonticola]
MGLLHNIKWVSLSQIVKILSQVIGMIVFSKYLSPKEIGIMSMALIVINFLNIVRDMGSSAAIIQAKELTENLKRSVFSLNLLVGLFVFIVVILTSNLISEFFEEKELRNVLVLIALAFPLASCTSVHLSLLERNSLFYKTARVEVISSLSGLILGVVAARCGWGVYSLVVQTLSYAFLSSVGFWISSEWRVRVGWSTYEISKIFRFSANLVGFNFVNYFSRNLDQIIIGRFFGPSVLGVYSLAYRLMLFPLQNITAVLTRSLYPILSRLQSNKEEGLKAYIDTLKFISIIIPPLMFGLSAVREDFVLVIFGEKWSDVSLILLWLAPTAVLQSMISTTGSVFMSVGKTELLLKISLFNAILQIIAFIIGGFHSVVILTFLYFTANLIMFYPNMSLAISMLNGKFRILINSIYKPISSSLIMYFSLRNIRDLKFINELTPDYRLLSSIFIGMCIYLFSMLLCERKYILSKIKII